MQNNRILSAAALDAAFDNGLGETQTLQARRAVRAPAAKHGAALAHNGLGKGPAAPTL